MSAPILLDLSRLLSRATRLVPTGIDRVEHAYAETLLRAAEPRLGYVAQHPLGPVRPLPRAPAQHFVERTGELWQHAASEPGRHPASVRSLARRLQAGMFTPRLGRERRPAGKPTYLLVSHHHLHRPDVIEAAKRRFDAAFVPFIHDLIPMELPEYGRPMEAAKHRRRMETAARFADALVFNSAATRDAFQPLLTAAGRDVPLLVAPLGIHPLPKVEAQAPPESPYFLYVGTIEPRKNHLLLLNLWRRLVAEMGERTPRLVLIGQRGWENEMVLDILERSETLRPVVREHNALPDAEVARLVAGARAVLLPSFAEGYGLPVAEALGVGTPVLCSDLPALREVGGAAPDYLDPLDGLGWLAAIRDYAASDSPRRQQQLDRIAAWSPPSWSPHIEAVLELIDALPH